MVVSDEASVELTPGVSRSTGSEEQPALARAAVMKEINTILRTTERLTRLVPETVTWPIRPYFHPYFSPEQGFRVVCSGQQISMFPLFRGGKGQHRGLREKSNSELRHF